MTDHDDLARLDAHAKKIGAPTLSEALAEFQRIRDKPPLRARCESGCAFAKWIKLPER